MKSDNNNKLPDALRRKLILALPIGVVGFYMASTLVGCGGGGGNPDDGTPSDTGGAFNGTESLRSVAVTVEVPAGVVLPMNGWLAVHTLLGGFGVVENGGATINMLDRGPQLATAYSSYGLPILFGFVGPDQPTLSSHTTAVVLLSFALGAEWLDGAAVAALRASLATTIAATTLAEAIEAALVADNTALGQMNPQIVEATQQAVLALLPNVQTQAPLARSLTRGLTVNPPDAKSGLQPIIADQLNTLYIQNDKLRRANYLIRRTGYLPATAASNAEVVVLADKPVVAEGEIPLPPAFDSVSGSISSVIEDYYSQGDGTDESLGSLAFSKSPLVPLTVEPADAKRTRYEVVVLTAGNPLLAIDETVYNSLPESNKLMITDFQPENLGLKMLVVDVLIPLFLTVVGDKISKEAEGLGGKEQFEAALFPELVGIILTNLPDIVAKLKGKNYGWGDAALDICRNRLIDFQDIPLPDGSGRLITVPQLSSFSISMLTLLLKHIGHEVLDAGSGKALVDFIDGDANVEEKFNAPWGDKVGEQLRKIGVAKVLALLAAVDNGLNILSKMRIFFDMSTSLPLEAWEVWTNSAKVRLTPNPLEVASGTAVKATITASIVDNVDDEYGKEKGPITFDWECSGRYGDLYSTSSTGSPNKFTSSKDTPSADYFTNGTEPNPANPETITVTAYFGGVNQSRQKIGSVTTTVKFKKEFNLGINPASMEVPADNSIGVTAFIKETLPNGAEVAWEWSHSGVGSIETLPVDGNPQDSAVNFHTESTEGAATITARATITVPGATPSTPPHIVEADPVTTTLQVKKGLKTITVEGYWQLEQGAIPLAGGPSCYISNASGKESCLLGYLDTWVVYIVPKVADAQSYAITIYTPTGGVLASYKPGSPNIKDGGSTLRIPFWAATGPYSSYDGVSNYATEQANGSGYIVGRAQTDGPRVVAVVTLKP